jgi:hypothetical protein
MRRSLDAPVEFRKIQGFGCSVHSNAVALLQHCACLCCVGLFGKIDERADRAFTAASQLAPLVVKFGTVMRSWIL